MLTKHRFLLFLILLTVVGSATGNASPDGPNTTGELKARAERFLRRTVDGDLSVVDDLASDNIVVSYEIFETLYKKTIIRGHEDFKKHVERFGNKWTDAKLTIDESLVDGNKVVLIWSFQARPVDGDGKPSDPQYWGGISPGSPVFSKCTSFFRAAGGKSSLHLSLVYFG
jgi:ketosteroid isomerase-like protein